MLATSFPNSSLRSRIQRLIFKYIPTLKEMALTSAGKLTQRKFLESQLSQLEEKIVDKLVIALNLCSAQAANDMNKQMKMELIITSIEERPPYRDQINNIPLYPSEFSIFDDNTIPPEGFSGQHCLAIPRINLQFLSLQVLSN